MVTDTHPITSPARGPIDRRQAAVAGAVAALVALGVTELIGALLPGGTSLVSAIGSVIVDRAPRIVVETAIALFGTADKGALAIGTVVVAMAVGAAIGHWRLRRFAAVVGLLGAVGVAAAWTQPGANVLSTLVTGVLGTLAGVGVLVVIRGAAEQPTDALADDEHRRRFIAVAGGAALAGGLAGIGGRRIIASRAEAAIAARPQLGVADPAPPPGPENAFAVPGLTPIVVPNDRFYRIDTALVIPVVDPESWRLRVRGMVDEEVILSLADLESMTLHEDYVTISCVSNEVGGTLVGNAKWTGVRLSEVLDRAGVDPAVATQVVGRSVDGWTAGFPTSAVFDGREPLIALRMNDEPLPARHGFPARLIVPGLYGYVSATKWLAEIELTTWEAFDAYWVPRGWAKAGPIKTQSRIDVPRPGETVTGKPLVAAGVAWAPHVGITAVEVRIDGGSWLQAELTEPLSEDAWVQWRVETTLEPGPHVIEVRATDATGTVQTPVERPPAPDGATGWHRVEFRSV